MFLRKAVLAAAASILGIGGFVGCANDAVATGDGVVNGGDSDLTIVASSQLYGPYDATEGPILGLVLSRRTNSAGAHEFVADVDTGAIPEHVTGTFVATTKTITFTPKTQSPVVRNVLGRYDYVRQGKMLVLSKTAFEQKLGAVDTYCSEASDCLLQDINHVECVGDFVCSARSTCSYVCGPPAR